MEPFKIKVSQCSVGRYNLLSSEESLSFYMSIYTEENKVYEENGIKAQLYYSGEPDELYIFEDAFDNLEEIFRKCFEYSNKIFSTTNYKEQCLLFSKIYHEYFETLETNTRIERDKKLLYEIEKLQKLLLKTNALVDISYQVNNCLNEKIISNARMIDYYIKNNSELKEGTETYNKNLEQISKYEKNNEHLKKYIRHE